jgi:aminoglycoside phosphotransferase
MYIEAAICDYLREEIFPQLAPPPYGEIEITRLGERKPVCLFFERERNVMVVGKLFKHGVVSLEEAWLEADTEYVNLTLLREKLGMHGQPDSVVAPLGENKELYALLVTERAPGQMLDHYIARAILELRYEELFQTLNYLARFFVKLHKNGETERPVSPDLAQAYLDSLLDILSEGPIDASERVAFEKYAARWWNKKEIFASDVETVVHGDATSTNFLLEDGNVTAIDLEKMKWSDRCWDLGFIAAELKHHFMWRTGDRWAAEPFIGHFLWQYAVEYGDAQFFYIITRKLPLYMALGLLRIARNLYLGDSYREGLVLEAKECLKYGL